MLRLKGTDTTWSHNVDAFLKQYTVLVRETEKFDVIRVGLGGRRGVLQGRSKGAGTLGWQWGK